MNTGGKSNYFVGKVCTIFTTPVNRNLGQENSHDYLQQVFNYFVGRIESIDEEGILTTQVTNGQKSFWFKNNVVGIAEEKVLDPMKDASIIEKLKDQATVGPLNRKGDSSPFLDPSKMSEIARQMKSNKP